MKPFLAYIMPVGGGDSDAHPEHPIAPGGPPPTIWPSPGHPAHPIVLPPDVIWPGPGPLPGVEHPIVIPPEAPPGETPPTGPLEKVEWHTVWTEQYGWAVIGVQTDPHPTPSKRK